jgi:hypothetical protein
MKKFRRDKKNFIFLQKHEKKVCFRVGVKKKSLYLQPIKKFIINSLKHFVK